MMFDFDIAVAAGGWIVAGAELIYMRWKKMPAQKKGELMEQLGDALEDGTISPEEAHNLVESFWATRDDKEKEDDKEEKEDDKS